MDLRRDIEFRRWNEVKRKVDSQNDTNSSEPHDPELRFLLAACQHKAPLAVIGALVAAFPSSPSFRASGTDEFGNTGHGEVALHVATVWSSIEVVRGLLVAEPSTALARDDRGRTPLLWGHLRGRPMIGTFRDALGRKRGGVAAALAEDRELAETWEKAKLVLCAAYHGAVDDPLPGKRSFRVVHSCSGVSDCRPELLRFGLELYPHQANEKDERGNYPLQIAIMTIPIRGRGGHQGGKLQRQLKMSMQKISSILNTRPETASLWSKSGGLPLHLALRSGLAEDSIRLIWDAYPAAVRAPDPTGLYSFMLAAVGERGKVSLVYSLLRAWPELEIFHHL